MKKRRFLPRSAAKNNKVGCDNAGRPIIKQTSEGEVYLEMTAIPKDIQDKTRAMFKETSSAQFERAKADK